MAPNTCTTHVRYPSPVYRTAYLHVQLHMLCTSHAPAVLPPSLPRAQVLSLLEALQRHPDVSCILTALHTVSTCTTFPPVSLRRRANGLRARGGIERAGTAQEHAPAAAPHPTHRQLIYGNAWDV